MQGLSERQLWNACSIRVATPFRIVIDLRIVISFRVVIGGLPYRNRHRQDSIAGTIRTIRTIRTPAGHSGHRQDTQGWAQGRQGRSGTLRDAQGRSGTLRDGITGLYSRTITIGQGYPLTPAKTYAILCSVVRKTNHQHTGERHNVDIQNQGQ